MLFQHSRIAHLLKVYKKECTKVKLAQILAVGVVIAAFFQPVQAFAATPDIASFTSQTLTTITVIASLVAVLMVVFGGYRYITANGKPDQVIEAKRIITQAVLGLLLVIGAQLGVTLLKGMLTTPNSGIDPAQLVLQPIQPATPSNSLTQVLLDSISGLIQNVIESATKPLVNGIMYFVTNTPSVVSNTTIFNFWLIMVGIVDSLFVLIIALLGLQMMSASVFGFEELELKQVLPRIGLAFIGANTSIFWIDILIQSSNVLVTSVLNATGGIEKAWLFTAFDPSSLIIGTAPLITLIFMLLFVVLAIVLLLFYIARLIIVALGAVLSPFLFLLWALPKWADFAEISSKTYFIAIFSAFVQVIIIQLASAFITFTGDTGSNSIISILVGVGLLMVLLKTPATLSTFVFYTSSSGMLKSMTTKLMNTVSSSGKSTAVSAVETIEPTKKINLRG